jgi:NTP pyrophosphatase (non-canonical NTP hydrolase)
MNFDEYQNQAQQTVITHIDPLMDKTIWVLGIAGESSEIAEKWKKIVAYENGDITEEKKAELAKEMGDVLWYLAAFARSLGLSLQEIAESNIEKVLSRKERGVTRGRGDNR